MNLELEDAHRLSKAKLSAAQRAMIAELPWRWQDLPWRHGTNNRTLRSLIERGIAELREVPDMPPTGKRNRGPRRWRWRRVR